LYEHRKAIIRKEKRAFKKSIKQEVVIKDPERNFVIN